MPDKSVRKRVTAVFAKLRVEYRPRAIVRATLVSAKGTHPCWDRGPAQAPPGARESRRPSSSAARVAQAQ